MGEPLQFEETIPPIDDREAAALIECGLGLEGVGMESEEPLERLLSMEELERGMPGFEDFRLLGDGGMGRVYRARRRVGGLEVAVKVIRAGKPGALTRFQREARVLAQLEHPHIVGLRGVEDLPGGALALVMELVEGSSLREVIAQGVPEVSMALGWLEQIASALDEAHSKGIVHRDIKPGNVLVTKEGRVKVADFGLAVELLADELRLTTSTLRLGTLEYAAPEQLRGAEVGPAADVYALGVLAYELLTGMVPRGFFPGPSSLREGLDPAFDAPVLTALQSDPGRRWQQAGEFVRSLAHAADEGRIREEREREIRERLMRRTRWVAAGLVLAVVFAALAGAVWWKSREARSQQRLAIQHRQEAEQLIDFLINDTVWRFQRPEELERWKPLFAKLDAYFERWRSQEVDAGFVYSLSTYTQAKAIWKDRVGSQSEAEALYRELVRQRDEYLTKPDALLDMGRANAVESRVFLGAALRRIGREAEGREVLAEARRKWSEWRSQTGSGAGLRLVGCRLSRAEAELAEVDGNTAEGLRLSEASLQEARLLMKEQPTNPAMPLELFDATRDLVRRLLGSHKNAEAMELANQLPDLANAVRKFSGEGLSLHRMALAQRLRYEVLQQCGPSQEARECLEALRQAALRLKQIDPSSMSASEHLEFVSQQLRGN